MNSKYFYIILLCISFSCTSNETSTEDESNKVLLLQVDFITNVFEGGKEFQFETNTQDFTISSNYQSPGDFGNIALYYEELNEMLFDGSIIWLGTGHRAFPENLTQPIDFEINTDSVEIPSLSNFEKVMYSEFSYYPDDINYTEIWEAISNLQLVTNYRESNPNSVVHLFLYTPSVGVGDPNEWDWILFLRN